MHNPFEDWSFLNSQDLKLQQRDSIILNNMDSPQYESKINIGQNSIANLKRDKPVDKRCVAIQINLRKKVDFGLSVWMGGSTDFLGNWSMDKALRMQWTEDNIWVLKLEEKWDEFSDEFEYKYLIR